MQSSKDFLLSFVRYNLWANNLLAEVFKTIDQSWIDKEVKSSFPSIRKTVFHLWGAEHLWLLRFSGISLNKFPNEEIPADTHPSEFVKGAKDFLVFVEKQDDAFFSASTTYKNLAGVEFTSTNSEIIFHVMNHSTFHRGQLVMMIRNLGFEGKLPSTDMISYFREK